MRTILMLVCVLCFTACVAQPHDLVFSSDLYFETAVSEETDTGDWQNVAFKGKSFSMPQGWIFFTQEKSAEEIAVADYRLLIQNSESAVHLGALNGASDFDLNETAMKREAYVVFNVLVYEKRSGQELSTWAEFFAEFYSEVTGYANFIFSDQPELSAVVVTGTSGVWLGDMRIFVHGENAFYDVSLHVVGYNRQEAEKLFLAFVQKFNF